MAMNRGQKAFFIFVGMQMFFVVFGVWLYITLKDFKTSLNEQALIEDAGPDGCTFPSWIGNPVKVDILRKSGRPYSILAPGAPVASYHAANRLIVRIDERGTVQSIDCARQ